MFDVPKPSANGKPESPPASASQPIGDYKREAAIVAQMSAAGALSVVAGKTLRNAVRPAGYKVYRDQLLKASGSPSDPLEIMLLEQAAVAHHRILSLHAQAAGVESAEMIEVLNTAATKLTAEFRRLCLAVREFRAPIVPKSVTLVKQQNLSAGNQQVALIDGTGHSVASEKTTDDSELVSKQEALTYEAPSKFNAAADCGKAELVETAGPNGRRTPAPQGRRPDQPAVGALDGPALASGQSEVSEQRQIAAAAIDLFSGAPAARG